MANFAALADRLIKKNGRAIQVRDTARTPVDALKPWGAQVEANTDYDTYGVFVDTQASDFLARVSAVSRLVLANVEVKKTGVLIPGTCPIVPTTNMQVVDGDIVWGIAKVSRVEPGPNVALYVVELGN